MGGITAGLLVWGVLAVAGLAAVLAASTTAYTVVKPSDPNDATATCHVPAAGVAVVGTGADLTGIEVARSSRAHW